MKIFKKCLAFIMAVFVMMPACFAAGNTNAPITPTGTIGRFAASRAIDQIVTLKGSALFHESGVGAYFYAFSGASSLYTEAFANIKLPTGYNNAGNTRNGYIALGIYGSTHGIDLGLKNAGTGWYPCYYDVGNKFGEFPAYKAPSTATNAKIVVKPVNSTTVRMYIQFLNSSGGNVGTPFDQNITVASGNLSGTEGNISCRFYRFASLVPIGADNQKDSSFMLGGQFTNLGLYNKNTSSYDTWGISTSRVTNAWLCSPERITLSYTANSDTFKIDHWST